MPVATTIPVSSLEFGNRIDAELYRSALRKSFEKLDRTGFGIKRLRVLCTIRSGTTPPDRIEGLRTGPILFKTTDIRNGVMSRDGDYYRISKGIHHRMVKTQLEDGDVLLNIVGATLDVIGRSAFVVGLRDEANITQAMVLLRCRTPELLPGYLFAYLNTRFGQDQIARYARPTGQYNLNLYEVGHICIPMLPANEQRVIEQLVLSAANYQDASTACYAEAKESLGSALGLHKLEFKEPVGYTTRVSQVQASRRIDSEHYFPEFPAFKDGLPSAISLSPLSMHLEFCQRGRQPSYAKSGLPVINSKHVQLNKVVTNGNRLAQPDADNKLQIRFGDTLVNGTGRGTIGRAAPYLAEGLSVADNHVTILRSRKLDPAFLALYLNSPAGRMQVDIHQRGSSGQLELYPIDIRKFLVWLPPLDFQLQIRRLHDQAAAAEAQSCMLIERAKDRVEQVINEAARP